MSSDTEFDAVIAAYLIPELAQDNFNGPVKQIGDDQLEVERVALVTGDADWTVAVAGTGDHLGRRGLQMGGGAGLAVGLFAPPLLAATAVVAAAGGLVGKCASQKVESGLGEKMGAALPPAPSSSRLPWPRPKPGWAAEDSATLETATMTQKTYEIHVRAPLPAGLLEELGRLKVAVEGPGTVLRGPVRDQAALLRVLLRLQDIGIELVELHQFPDRPATEGDVAVNFEIVVEGGMRDLVASAFPELVVERRQTLVTSESNAAATLAHLKGRRVDVLVVRPRARPLPPELTV